jgi:hypothetical protein
VKRGYLFCAFLAFVWLTTIIAAICINDASIIGGAIFLTLALCAGYAIIFH